jgi:hypothetical protein
LHSLRVGGSASACFGVAGRPPAFFRITVRGKSRSVAALWNVPNPSLLYALAKELRTAATGD